MKIKTVCDITGLTDRTVRYYIEEGLISPAYTENYLGRKSFDFTEADVQQLKDISVLRKFGFSITEIKEIHGDPKKIFHIVKDLQQRKQDIIDEENELLQALLERDAHHCYSLSELAQHLVTPVVNEPYPVDVAYERRQKIKRFIKAFLLGIITWLPIGLAVTLARISRSARTYPHTDLNALLSFLLALSPSIYMLLRTKFKIRRHRSKIGLALLCILSIPHCMISGTALFPYSETSDIYYYRELDPECTANLNCFFHELFPNWPNTSDEIQLPDGSYETVYTDARYYYHYDPFIDEAYDIYAQWPLEKAEFYEEIARVRALYEKREYVTVKHGDYICYFSSVGGDPPFQEATTSYYTYYIFAYDEQNLTVRYIMSYSLDGAVHQPYYMSLDW